MATVETKPGGKAARPLSPHLMIYRLTWTMVMSGAHRITGMALCLGTILLAIWLIAVASGPAAYAATMWVYGSWFGKLVLFGYTWALIHHLIGGLRHLSWDIGVGLSREGALKWAQATMVASAVLTVLVWLVVLIVALA
jgi:succinate dehydrogenase / fumarate reductase cytochrome b subunit